MNPPVRVRHHGAADRAGVVSVPILKPISGHTGLAKARDYLERDGRALAHDFLNLDAPELGGDGELPTYGEFDWAEAMDATRAEFGNDTAWAAGGHAPTSTTSSRPTRGTQRASQRSGMSPCHG